VSHSLPGCVLWPLATLHTNTHTYTHKYITIKHYTIQGVRYATYCDFLHVQPINQHITVVTLCQKMVGHPSCTKAQIQYISSPPSWQVSIDREIFQSAQYQHHRQIKNYIIKKKYVLSYIVLEVCTLNCTQISV
jgi:hypothetical protein